MVDPIAGNYEDMTAALIQRAREAKTMGEREKVKDEFLALFYKEVLKQAFTPKSLGLAGEENSFASTYTADLMVNKLAHQLVESRQFDILDSKVKQENDKANQ